jgi:hypothetical protein
MVQGGILRGPGPGLQGSLVSADSAGVIPLELLLRPCAPYLAALAAAPAPEAVTWAQLADAPECLLGEQRIVFVQSQAALEPWEPYLTRFSPERYAGLAAWSDEQLPWIEDDYRAPAASVFVRRATRLERFLASCHPHERLALRVVVRTAHLGRPWVEVLGVQRARRTVPEGTVLHAEKALELMARGSWDLAQDQLGRALAAPLPAHARGELEELARRCEAAYTRPGR